MGSVRFKHSGFSKFKVSTSILAFCWSFFLSVGVIIGSQSGVDQSFRQIFLSSQSVSFLYYLLFRGIVLIASILSAQFHFNWPILILSSFRGLCYGVMLGVALACFGDSAWLYLTLFTLSNSFSVIVDIWFWRTIILQNANSNYRKTQILYFINFLLIVFNYIISPFSWF